MLLKRLQELHDLVKSCEYTAKGKNLTASEAIEGAHQLLIDAKNQIGIVYVIGNGGSAGIASHFCIDLLKTLQIPAQTLYDSNSMTCFSNDLGYEQIFSAPLKSLIQPRDLLVAISSSGKSPNILNGVKVAREKGAKIISLSGFASSNPLRNSGDLNFWLDRADYGLVEMGHFFLLHTIIDLWKNPTSPISKMVYAEQN